MSEFEISPPFGTYALPAARENWRLRAGRFGDNPIGRSMISFCRKKAVAGLDGPFDVQVEHDIFARLYPHDNRTEKRALAGPQIWEVAERRHMRAAAAASPEDFVFIDAGANIGLYALYAEYYAKAEGKRANIYAIEPSPETIRRLKTNIAAGNSSVKVIETALSDHKGTGHLTDAAGNRGEIKLAKAGADEVSVDTLFNVCRDENINRIDVLKTDIEDHEETVLRAFFTQAPT